MLLFRDRQGLQSDDEPNGMRQNQSQLSPLQVSIGGWVDDELGKRVKSVGTRRNSILPKVEERLKNKGFIEN